MPRPAKPELIQLLTCSITDYARNQGRDPTVYDLIGPAWGQDATDINIAEKALRKYAFDANLEAIVDLKYTLSDSMKHVSGTGVRLKKIEP